MILIFTFGRDFIRDLLFAAHENDCEKLKRLFSLRIGEN